MTKQQLRKRYLTKRQQLPDRKYAGLNQNLLRQFQKLDLTDIHCIHLFLPIKPNKEPDTFLIRDWLKTTHPHIKIVFPKANFRTLVMKSYADDDQLQLAENSYGIPEPISGAEVPANEIDLILLPLLAFDKKGYRVGYGKGFYDHFVAQCKPGTKFIGLSLFDPVEHIDNVNEHDVRMHACLTPTEMWDWHYNIG